MKDKKLKTIDPKDFNIAELRVIATLLADRAGLVGKGVPFADLVYGKKKDLIKIVERAQRRKAKKKLAKKKATKKKSTKKSTKKKQK